MKKLTKFWLNILTILALAGILQIPLDAQAQSSQPPTTITLTMYPLDTQGAKLGNIPCSQMSTTFDVFGCTAIEGDPNYIYPYNSSTITLNIENEYLPNVLPGEMFPPEFITEAMRAQAIAARSYAYYQINNNGSNINNSTQFQMFIPYRFNIAGNTPPNQYVISRENPCSTTRRLLNQSQRKVCSALYDRLYLAEKTSLAAINAEFFADYPHGAIPQERTQAFVDPISSTATPCAANINGHGRGLSQRGTNRWLLGNRCSLGNPSVPWSVQYNRAEQALSHYYPGADIRSVLSSNTTVPALRWNPLSIDWQGIDRFNLQSGSTYDINMKIQNTGKQLWLCTPSTSYELGFTWTHQGTEVQGPRIQICNATNPGDSATEIVTLSNLPTISGNYTLVFDMYKVVNGTATSFRSLGAWTPHSVNVKIRANPCNSGTACSMSTPLDLVYVVDTTNNSGELDGSNLWSLQSTIASTINILTESGVDYRIGIVEFRDFPQDTGNTTDFAARVALGFTTNKINIMNTIEGLSADGGGSTGEESVYSGLMTASTMPWRTDAIKSIILLTNASPLNPEPYTGYTAQSVVSATQNSSLPIQINSIITYPDDNMEMVYSGISATTKGTYYPIYHEIDTLDTMRSSINGILSESIIAKLPEWHSASINYPISFDASASRTVHGTVASYEWDFDNDGTIDQITTTPVANHAYSTPYFGGVKLTIRDFVGNYATTSTHVGIPYTLPKRVYIPFVLE
ncbi:MAG: hypothetical protein LCH85_17085 [Chloroflexi bacterium]|nr:hypothetical protein [Chloroflexota bacterium]